MDQSYKGFDPNFLPVKTKEMNRLDRVTTFDIVNLIIQILIALVIVYPFYNTILVSLVPQVDYVRSPFMLLPKRITFESYQFVFESRLLLRSMRTSILMMISGTAYNMTLTILMAYAFTKPLPGKTFFRFLNIFTMYFGGGLVPYYLLINAIGLSNSFWVMVFPTVISVPYMLIVSNYFSSIPIELVESASMDGATEMRILLVIILPLSLPILATFTLYYAVERWNEWYSAMLFIKDVNKWPLQMTLRKIIQDANFIASDPMTGEMRPPTYGEGVKMASIVITVFPLMAVYPFLQRYFLTGLTLGAVKG